MSNVAFGYMMFLQLGVEILLVALLLVLLKRTKAATKSDPAHMPENLKNSIEKFLSESEKIAASFDQNLRDKKNLSADLILKLDRRISDYHSLLKQTEASLAAAQKKLADLKNTSPASLPKSLGGPMVSAAEGKANPAAPEVRALVLHMAKKGHSPEENATNARQHLGEDK